MRRCPPPYVPEADSCMRENEPTGATTATSPIRKTMSGRLPTIPASRSARTAALPCPESHDLELGDSDTGGGAWLSKTNLVPRPRYQARRTLKPSLACGERVRPGGDSRDAPVRRGGLSDAPAPPRVKR